MERLKPKTKNERVKKAFCVTLVALVVLGAGALVGYAIGQANKEREVKTARSQEANRYEQEKANNQARGDAVPVKQATEATCNADELSLSIQPGQDGAAAGSNQYEVVLQNSSERECTLGGYPGVSLVNDNGNQVGEPADRAQGAEMPEVSLRAGTSVRAAIVVPNSDNFPEGECKDGATKLRVYPPNDTGYLSVNTDITTWCKGFSVWPVVAVE